MDKEKLIQLIEYWMQGSEDEWEYMDVLYHAGKYVPALFFLHLSIEKILKAYYVKEIQDYAPLTHHLVFIAKKSNIDLSEEYESFLTDLFPYNLATRYPEDRNNLKENCSKSLATALINKGKDFKEWLLAKLK